MNISDAPTRLQGKSPIHGLQMPVICTVTARSFGSFRGTSLAATVAILELARRIEPGVGAAVHWYRHEPIAELGSLSARQLVAQGEGESVLAFLKAIHRGDRG